ncbi:MAG TPA: ABC transporter ATP-binding protein [Paracoccaceae bacterium]|nr:ABC transporter ATP-binding protein [Paracoccaceae bacterium]
MSLLAIRDLSVTLGGRRVVHGISLDVGAGECVGLIGPNGAGKSTAMRAALGLIPAQGTSNLREMPPPVRARHAAWLPQGREIAWDVSVEALVKLGRLPYRRFAAPLSDTDRKAVAFAMDRTETTTFASRSVDSLSGGEQARVLLARALAQEAPLLLADEPIAALDPAHQIATMESFADLAREGKAVVTALHDLGLAARWCTRLILLDQGRIVADGPPNSVLTVERIRAVYGIDAYITHAAGGLIVEPIARTG